MNQTVPLYWILAGIVIVALLYMMWLLGKAVHESAGRISELVTLLNAAIAKNTEAQVAHLAVLAPAATDFRSALPVVQKLLESVAKIGSAQLEVMQRQRGQAGEAPANPFGRGNGRIPPRDIAASEQEFDVQQAMRVEGITREEAMLRQNGANQRSVWDGNTVFDNWT